MEDSSYLNNLKRPELRREGTEGGGQARCQPPQAGCPCRSQAFSNTELTVGLVRRSDAAFL